MTAIEKILLKLPSDLEAIARVFLPVLLGWGENEAIEWLNEFMAGDYDAAMKKMYGAMTPADRDLEQNRQLDVLKALNVGNAALVASQRWLVWRLFLTALSWAEKENG
ncbi:MAG: hypothetical protein MUO31_13130 [Thermodesulfovibrionales bacterium]|nr:hypothetical protein [Thermodesulfovibrionales bacterium]